MPIQNPGKQPETTTKFAVPRLLAMLLLLALTLTLAACQNPELNRALEEWALRQQAAATPGSNGETTGQPDAATIQAIAESGNRLLILGQDGNIYTSEPDGTNALAYTSDATDTRQYLQPTWSPAGDRIAWTMVDQTSAGPENRVFISTLDGRDLRQYALASPPFYYYWSPDGEKLAYLGVTGPTNANSLSLRVIDLLGPEDAAVRTVDQGQPLYFAWDPTGERLLTHVGETRLEVHALEGGSQILAATNAGFPAPQWTRDGQQILYATAAGPGTRQLTLQTLANGDSRVVTTYDERIAFDLAPAGTRLAYAISPANAASSALGPLYVVDLETGSTRELTTAPVLAFFWSPDGQKLAYLATTPQRSGSNIQVRLRWYVWDGARSRGYDTILPSRTFLQSYLTFFDQYARSMTIWSPDSTAFSYAGIDGLNRSGIWVQRLDAERPERVAPGVFVAWSPR